jgi:hypothetical protein
MTGIALARFQQLSVPNRFTEDGTQWRLLRPSAVNRRRTYEKVRFTVTARTTSFDCSQLAVILRLRLRLLRESEIRAARFGDRYHQKEPI